MPLPSQLDPSRISTRRVVVVGATAILLVSVAVGLSYRAERARLKAALWTIEYLTVPPRDRLKFQAEGIRTPPTLSADRADLKPEDEVIGVEVDGRARAYRLKAMLGRSDHVVNDVLGGKPVSVTYCDLSGCVRGFGGPGEAPLTIDQAGIYKNKMTLKVDGVVYVQDDGEVVEHDEGRSVVPFPFDEVPLTRTTWGAWKAGHPGTDVYVGTGVDSSDASK